METPTLGKIIEAYDPERPLVLVPPGYTFNSGRDWELKDPSKILFLTTSRYVVDYLSTNRPDCMAMTFRMFVNRYRKTNGWGMDFEYIVVLGSAGIGNFRALQSKTLHLALRHGHKVLCLTSDIGHPQKIYSVAKSLGVARQIFGSWKNFVAAYCKLHPGSRAFGPNWITGIRTDRLEALKTQTEKFCQDYRGDQR